MGEEKPDEELMGKRKSSPRLSPTPLSAGNIIVASNMKNIRTVEKITGEQVGASRDWGLSRDDSDGRTSRKNRTTHRLQPKFSDTNRERAKLLHRGRMW
ncbi:hypothetical protein FPZ45_18295 [Cohnella terricola]|uniref:Uncharacterized protein n=1 Tax=Cohnella terricola TaxID=1289167 RepID=A0A559JCX1_9BACL|nr:hypothetical protein FPZ45_18295 [Cohnella terricola]